MGLTIPFLPPLWRLFARFSKLGKLLLLPLVAAFRKDAFEEGGGGFNVVVTLPPILGQLALYRRPEDGGTIPLKVGLHPQQVRNPGVEVREEFLDLGDDANLLVDRSHWDKNALYFGEIKSRSSDTVDDGPGSLARLLKVQNKVEILRKDGVRIRLEPDAVCFDDRWSDPIRNKARSGEFFPKCRHNNIAAMHSMLQQGLEMGSRYVSSFVPENPITNILEPDDPWSVFCVMFGLQFGTEGTIRN